MITKIRMCIDIRIKHGNLNISDAINDFYLHNIIINDLLKTEGLYCIANVENIGKLDEDDYMVYFTSHTLNVIKYLQEYKQIIIRNISEDGKYFADVSAEVYYTNTFPIYDFCNALYVSIREARLGFVGAHYKVDI